MNKPTAILTLLALLSSPTLAQRCQWATVRYTTDLVLENLVNPDLSPVSPFPISSPTTATNGGLNNNRQDEEWIRILAVSPSRPLYAYTQNLHPIAPDSQDSILSVPIREVLWTHSVVDQEVCAGAIRMLVTTGWGTNGTGEEDKAYLLSAQVRFNASLPAPPVVESLDVVVVGEGDWGMSAEGFVEELKEKVGREVWSAISYVQQETRERLVDVANAYLDFYYGGGQNGEGSEKGEIWGKPCSRLDGLVYTSVGEGDETADCAVVRTGGVTDRQVLVDESVGAVSVFGKDGSLGGAPGAWLFRVVEGRVRYIHHVSATVG
ncbi:hypothetical protein VTJ04DRAFT_129 [Mycothermus thermophilus]|uniref:uncharacterized protein n=1 Tax=Humicola insolens TaxID=85995 RepID=UPI0037432153